MWVFLALLLNRCSSSDDNGSNPTSTPTPAAPATFSEIQTNIFAPSCTQSACHDASAGGNLDLTSTSVSYPQLVGIAADQTSAAARGKVRVIAGDADNSFLIQKLDGTLESDEGDVMPRNTSGLSSTRIDQIRSWINDGAPNN